jgi:hypothetical protein
MLSRRSIRLGVTVSVVVLRLLAKREIERTTFGRWHEVQAEKEEKTAGDDSSVYVDTLSVCRDVASIRLLRTSLCLNVKEDGHVSVGNPVSRTRRRRGRILVVEYVARVTVCDVDGLGSKEAGHRSFVVVTINRATGQG